MNNEQAVKNSAGLVLAMAVKNLFPTVKLGGGAVQNDGFFQDFDFVTPIKQDDLPKIEAEMQRIIKRNLPLEREVKLGSSERKKVFAKEIYLQGIKTNLVKIDNFFMPNSDDTVNYTSKIKAFRVMQITGAYWKGDAKNKMLTRLFGVAFDNKASLAEWEALQEEIRKRDHNRIGRELELFTTVDIVGQGLPHFMPRGAKVMQILQRFVEDEEERRGYLHVKTPLMAKRELYKLSGHWEHYKDGMFVIGNEVLDDEVFALRPMTCPFHFFIYKNGIKSYRDLPIRYGETSTLFRNEASGEMHGLTRMRQFTLSEGHIVAREDQMEQVSDEWIDLVNFMMERLGIADKISYRLSKWDPANKEKYIGNPKAWEAAQDNLRKVLKAKKLPFVEADGEAAFYGPKIDLQARNVYGKEDTILTFQLDFQLAERYDMSYVDEKGYKTRPVIFHRTSVGCYERTLAMIIENTGGAFPTWLAPVQAVVMGISNKQDDYVESVAAQLRRGGVRVEKDLRAEKVGYKIREHTVKKVPFLVVVGEKEQEGATISVRTREGEELGSMKVEELIKKVLG